MTILSAYKNWVGLAKVTTDTVIATAVAAAATSVKVASATGITTASTIVILDGPNTEVRAVSAVTATTLTVTALSHAHPKGAYVFALPTSGFGPTAYIPLKTFKVVDKYPPIFDDSRSSSLGDHRGAVQGMRESEWSIDGYVFADTFGYVIGGFFGSEDYAAGPPKTHTFSTKNTGNGQPVKYAWFVYDGLNVRCVVGRTTKVGVKFTPKAAVTFTSTVMARASGVVSTATVSLSTLPLFPSWKGALTIATTFNQKAESFTLTLTRAEAENIPTLTGTQDPLDTFVGAVQATVKGSLVKTGDTQLNAYYAGTQQKVVLTLASKTGTTTIGIQVQMTKALYDTFEDVLQGKAFNTETFSITGITNTSDATTSGGGIAPCRVKLTNAIATGKYV